MQERENLQAESQLSVKTNAVLDLTTHEIIACAETKSQTFNEPSHSGTPYYPYIRDDEMKVKEVS